MARPLRTQSSPPPAGGNAPGAAALAAAAGVEIGGDGAAEAGEFVSPETQATVHAFALEYTVQEMNPDESAEILRNSLPPNSAGGKARLRDPVGVLPIKVDGVPVIVASDGKAYYGDSGEEIEFAAGGGEQPPPASGRGIVDPNAIDQKESPGARALANALNQPDDEADGGGGIIPAEQQPPSRAAPSLPPDYMPQAGLRPESRGLVPPPPSELQGPPKPRGLGFEFSPENTAGLETPEFESSVSGRAPLAPAKAESSSPSLGAATAARIEERRDFARVALDGWGPGDLDAGERLADMAAALAEEDSDVGRWMDAVGDEIQIHGQDWLMDLAGIVGVPVAGGAVVGGTLALGGKIGQVAAKVQKWLGGLSEVEKSAVTRFARAQAENASRRAQMLSRTSSAERVAAGAHGRQFQRDVISGLEGAQSAGRTAARRQGLLRQQREGSGALIEKGRETAARRGDAAAERAAETGRTAAAAEDGAKLAEAAKKAAENWKWLLDEIQAAAR